MLPGYRRKGSFRSGTAQPGEGYGSRKTVPDPGGGRNKKQPDAVASEHIAPLQDAADLEIATEEETSLLEAWKKYRVLLNRVDTSTAPDIEWPYEPCQGVIIGIMPQHVLSKNVLRLDGELSIVRVLNDFQPLQILRAN